MAPPSSSLAWLNPELDRCRQLIARRASPRTWTKDSAGGRPELVTEVDLEVERLLVEAIEKQLPHAAILSEESNPDPSALTQATCFVIDPIDGTQELAAGRTGFAISIALLEQGHAVAAILDLPAQDRRFESGADDGVRLNGGEIQLRTDVPLPDARLAVSATQHGMDSLRSFWACLGAGSLVPTPAFTPKFAAVLSGDCDAALYLPVQPHRTAVWDYAAAAHLLARAGGWFGTTEGTDLLQTRPYDYSGGWIAAAPALRDELLARLEQLGDLGDGAR
jgi:myo-inositol-1(or 4)-monophosphatase